MVSKVGLGGPLFSKRFILGIDIKILPRFVFLSHWSQPTYSGAAIVKAWRRLKPLTSGKPLPYRYALPTANHVFLPGHRLMVQIQSSWFPLYDLNPQTFVPNIFWAKPPARPT